MLKKAFMNFKDFNRLNFASCAAIIAFCSIGMKLSVGINISTSLFFLSSVYLFAAMLHCVYFSGFDLISDFFNKPSKQKKSDIGSSKEEVALKKEMAKFRERNTLNAKK